MGREKMLEGVNNLADAVAVTMDQKVATSSLRAAGVHLR